MTSFLSSKDCRGGMGREGSALPDPPAPLEAGFEAAPSPCPDLLCAPRASAWQQGRTEHPEAQPVLLPRSGEAALGLCRMDVFSCLSEIFPGGNIPVISWMLEGSETGVAYWISCGVISLLLPLLPLHAGVGFLATSSWMMEVAQPWDCHPAMGARAGPCRVPPGAVAGRRE